LTLTFLGGFELNQREEPNQNHKACQQSVNRTPSKTSAQEGWLMPSCSSAIRSLQTAQLRPPDRCTWSPHLSWPHRQTGTVAFLPYMSLMMSAKGWRFLKILLRREPGRNHRREGFGIQPAVSNVMASVWTCMLTEGPSKSHVSASECRSSQQQSNSPCTKTSNSWMQSECQFGFRAPSELHWTWTLT